MSSPWTVLGLPPGASETDMKHAYRKLVLQYHPDRHASSTVAEQEAAATRFKVITEAYNTLTNDRTHSAYRASSSSSSSSTARPSRAHYNVNTDWTHYNQGDSSGYTSRISRWELYRRIAKQSYRSFGQALHWSLAVVLVGGGLLFEVSHNALWQARNKGKSFEEVQQLVKAQKESKATTSSSTAMASMSSVPQNDHHNKSNSSSSKSSSDPQQQHVHPAT